MTLKHTITPPLQTTHTPQLVDYPVATTHPANPEHTGANYKRKVKGTASATQFLSLNIDPTPPPQAQASACGWCDLI